MAKKTSKRAATGALAPMADRFVARFAEQPHTGPVLVAIILLCLAVYAPGLGYPLVFADFSELSPERLKRYTELAPAIGHEWLAQASFGWLAQWFGVAWSTQRVLNLVVHTTACVFAFLLFRAIVERNFDSGGGVASAWVAAAAAGLFAVHPAAIYGVAYLAEREHLLAGCLALVAMWSAAHGTRCPWPWRWTIGILAYLAALLSTPRALTIPIAMAVVVLATTRGRERYAWTHWGLVAATLVLGVIYGVTPAAPVQASVALGSVSADLANTSIVRYLSYLALWLVPATPWMAVDIAEPAFGWWSTLAMPVTLLLALAFIAVLGLLVLRGGVGACIAAALLCTLALYSTDALSPLWAEPFALAVGYAAFAPACLVLASAAARLPRRAAVVCLALAALGFCVLAASKLQTFASHDALWDDAVRRVERAGADAKDVRIYLNRAAMHRRSGHLIAAVSDYDKALSLAPDSRRALRGRAQALIEDKQYARALADLDRLLELDPGQPNTVADRALVLMQAGRLEEAGHTFDKAVELGAKEPRVFLNRGLARLQVGGIEVAAAALVDIERAIEIDPKYAIAHFNRGLIFEEAAKAGLRLRGAVSPELMRAVAAQNIARACELGHAGACARQRGMQETKPADAMRDEPIRITPETLRERGLPLPLKKDAER